MGEVFAGRYELADPIGRGGVGAVWRAWDHRRRRYVAAKVLQQSDAHALLRFVREQALRIDHPHVLAPASWAADDDKVLFTMDLVAGGSLVHLVGDYGPLPPAFVCTLLDQLLAGLDAVHAEGVVHRDIKPANILLEATGTNRPRLRLSDFGIAMRLGEPRLTETNLVVGTPGYLAPEQMMGAEPDFPADLFAVGLTALYLLEGAKPDAKALIQYFTAHGTPRAPQGIPDPLWQVVASLLQPDPHARFRTATGARKALSSAAELLPEPGPDDEIIEIFDQLGPLPSGFAASGPLKRAPGVDTSTGAGLSLCIRDRPTVADRRSFPVGSRRRVLPPGAAARGPGSRESGLWVGRIRRGRTAGQRAHGLAARLVLRGCSLRHRLHARSARLHSRPARLAVRTARLGSDFPGPRSRLRTPLGDKRRPLRAPHRMGRIPRLPARHRVGIGPGRRNAPAATAVHPRATAQHVGHRQLPSATPSDHHHLCPSDARPAYPSRTPAATEATRAPAPPNS
ncbi:serine/threonine protein kinase, partial [Streptomyces resistomycificus]|uniref:serine/threonine protein kinase n=1 Tax=Streptomyces resistomycificus TaxID=67356 RepID=UPI001CED3094